MKRRAWFHQANSPMFGRARLSVWFGAIPLIVAAITLGGATSLRAATVARAAELAALNASNGSQRWVTTPGGVGLVVAGEDRGVVVVASSPSCRSSTSTLRGLDARTGHQRWQAEIASRQGGLREAVAGAGVAVARASTNTFEGIDVKTGKVRWHSEALTPSPSGPPPPVFAGSRVVVAGVPGEPPTPGGPPIALGDNGIVRAIDARTGTTSWTTPPLDGEIDGVAADAVSVYLAVPAAGPEAGLPALEIRALDANTGVAMWQRSLGQVESFAPLLVADGTVVATGNFATGADRSPTASEKTATQIVGLDASNGQLRWRLDVDEHTNPASAGSAIVAVHDGKPTAVDGRTGKQLWEATAPLGIKEAGLNGTDRLVVVSSFDSAKSGGNHTGVAALDAHTGKLRWQNTGRADLVTTDRVYTSLLRSTRSDCPSGE